MRANVTGNQRREFGAVGEMPGASENVGIVVRLGSANDTELY